MRAPPPGKGRWAPQPMDLVATPRYLALDPNMWSRGVLLHTPQGNPSHWVLLQPLTGALGWTRPPDADWFDPEVQAIEKRLVLALAQEAQRGTLAGDAFTTVTYGQKWEPVKLQDIWTP